MTEPGVNSTVFCHSDPQSHRFLSITPRKGVSYNEDRLSCTAGATQVSITESANYQWRKSQPKQQSSRYKHTYRLSILGKASRINNVFCLVATVQFVMDTGTNSPKLIIYYIIQYLKSPCLGGTSKYEINVASQSQPQQLRLQNDFGQGKTMSMSISRYRERISSWIYCKSQKFIF